MPLSRRVFLTGAAGAASAVGLGIGFSDGASASVRKKLGWNLSPLAPYAPCPLLDQIKVSTRGVANARKASFGVPFAPTEQNYTALVDAAVSKVQGKAPRSGVASFNAVGKVGKLSTISIETGGLAADIMPPRLVRTEWLPNLRRGEVFTPVAVKSLSGASMLRFMDWARTNSADYTEWTQVNAPSYAALPVPIEIMAALCNLTGSDGWLPIHYKLPTPEAVRVVTLFRKLLNPRLKLYVEYSNEVWNWGRGFNAGREAAAVKATPEVRATANPARWYGERAAALQRAVARVPGQQMILAWKWVSGAAISKVITEFKAAGGDMKTVAAIAAAPYIRLGGTTKWDEATDAVVLQGLADNQASTARLFKIWGDIAKANGVQFFLYEAGFEMGSSGKATPEQKARRLALTNHPALGEILTKHLAGFAEAGGTYACLFNNVDKRNVYGMAADYDDLKGDPRRQAFIRWNASAG